MQEYSKYCIMVYNYLSFRNLSFQYNILSNTLLNPRAKHGFVTSFDVKMMVGEDNGNAIANIHGR